MGDDAGTLGRCSTSANRDVHAFEREIDQPIKHREQVGGAVDSIVNEAGRLDVLVNNAALPALKKSRGVILNISSAVGHKVAPGASHYAATKAAIESLTRSWALERAADGVRVNALAPGPTDSGVFEKVSDDTGMPAAALKAAFVEQVPLGRIASTEEVVHWIVAMAAPSATFLTGQVLSIDGGMSLT